MAIAPLTCPDPPSHNPHPIATPTERPSMSLPTFTFKYRAGGQQFPFAISGPFLPGHPLTPGEAQALNQLLAERVRENCRPAFDAAAGAAPSGIPGPEALEEVQAKITRYAENFQFLERHVGSQKQQLSPIEREALELARGVAADGASEAEIELLAQSIELVAEATERCRIRAEIARSGLDAL